MAKPFRTFRFDLQVYAAFKGLASRNGYTVTSALEKFTADALTHVLSNAVANKGMFAVRAIASFTNKSRF